MFTVAGQRASRNNKKRKNHRRMSTDKLMLDDRPVFDGENQISCENTAIPVHGLSRANHVPGIRYKEFRSPVTIISLPFIWAPV